VCDYEISAQRRTRLNVGYSSTGEYSFHIVILAICMMGLINVWIWFQAKINKCNKAERKVWT
jgi:hypothetical protein